MAIRKKIKLQKGRAVSQLVPDIQDAISTIVKGGVLQRDMALYLCDGPPDLRSLSQNAYYHGVVLRAVAEHTGDHVSDVHGFYKKTFGVTFRSFNGELFEDHKSTSEMGKAEFMRYVEMIRLHALDNFGLHIPLPGEVPDEVLVFWLESGQA